MFFIFKQKLYRLLLKILSFFDKNKWFKYLLWAVVYFMTFVLMFLIFGKQNMKECRNCVFLKNGSIIKYGDLIIIGKKCNCKEALHNFKNNYFLKNKSIDINQIMINRRNMNCGFSIDKKNKLSVVYN